METMESCARRKDCQRDSVQEDETQRELLNAPRRLKSATHFKHASFDVESVHVGWFESFPDPDLRQIFPLFTSIYREGAELAPVMCNKIKLNHEPNPAAAPQIRFVHMYEYDTKFLHKIICINPNLFKTALIIFIPVTGSDMLELGGWRHGANNRMLREKSPPGNPAGRLEQDILAISTVYIKIVFNAIRDKYDKIRNSRACRVFTKTTQPAHVAVMFIALFVAASLHSSHNTSKSHNILFKFVYAASTAAHFGSQIWMTFASGLSLYFSLPRHHFGEVQKVLFPLYFSLTSVLSFATLFTHTRLISCVETTVVLTACFFLEFFVRLYLCNPLVRLICIKNEMEAKHGLGMEVGMLSHDSELFQSHEYVAVHRRFRRLHMFIALSNIACIGFSTAHLYFSVSNNNFL